MNKGAFSEEFENGSRKIKKEKLEDMDFEVETLHHAIDIKEETSIVESQSDEDCKFTPELKVDIAGTTGTDRLLESDNLVFCGVEKESPLICYFGLEPQNNIKDFNIQDTPAAATLTKYFTRSCNLNNRNKGGLRTRKESSDISALREKLQLQIEYLKLQNCLTKLQTLKLERQLKLSKS